MFKAAFSGRSETGGSGSGAGRSSKDSSKDKDETRRKKSSHSHRAESVISTTSRRDDDRERRRSHRASSLYDNASSYTSPGNSAYVTAPSSRVGETRPLTESALRMLPNDDDEWEDEDRDARSEKKSRRRESGDEKRRKSARSEKDRSRSRSRDRKEKRKESSKTISGDEKSRGKDKDRSRRQPELVAEGSRAIPEMGSFEQFPGQYAGGMIGQQPPRQDAIMSGALPSSVPQQQFPGSDYGVSNMPSHPPQPTRADSYGAAAEYYLDEGQSVGFQPGARPFTPNMLVNPDLHLHAATASPHPVEDTGNGAAADFYSGKVSPVYPVSASAPVTPAKPPKSSKIFSSSASKPSKSSKTQSKPQRTSSSGASAAALAAAGIGALAGSSKNNHSSSHSSSQQHQQTSSSSYPQTSGTFTSQPGRTHSDADVYYAPPQSSSASTYPPTLPPTNGYSPQVSNDSGRAGKQSTNSNVPLYAAGAAAAGLAAYEYNQHSHNHSSQQPNSYNMTPGGGYGVGGQGPPRPPRPGAGGSGYYPSNGSGGGMSMQQHHFHEHKGPITRLKDGLLDLISSPEDTAKMEMYTEYIGVCKHCFDPRTSAWDAPRVHHYHKRRDSFENLRRRRSHEKMTRKGSNESLRRQNSRVDKDSRYYASDSSRRKRESGGSGILGAGLAAAGVAAGANALFNDRKNFDDTYSVKSGHRESSAVRRRSRSSSREQRRRSTHGVVRPDRDEYVTVRRKDGTLERRKVARKSRSSSRDRKSNYLGTAAAGAALGAVGLAASSRYRSKSRSRSRSPSVLNGKIDSRSRRRDRRSPGRSSSNYQEYPQESGGFFGGFFSPPQKKRRSSREHHKKRQGFFTFSNGSSSSSNSELAFGDAFSSRTSLPSRRKASTASNRSGRKANRKKSDEHLAATVAGIGATAAALAAAQRGHRISKRSSRPELGRRRDVRYSTDHPATSEDEWEDELPSDVDDESSVDGGLAFGDYKGKRLSSRQSLESVGSQSSAGGLGAWGWRWGGKDQKRKSRKTSNSMQQRQYPPSVGSFDASRPIDKPVYLDDTGRPLPSIDSTSTASVSQGPMQFVEPQPIPDSISMPGSRHTSMPGAFDYEPPVIRPGPGPIQHPQPISPAQPAFTQSQPQIDHPYSTPTTRSRRANSSPTRGSLAQDAALIGAAALATGSIIAGSSSRKSKDPSNVRFGLTEEQQRKDDRDRQKEDKKNADDERRRADRARAVKEEAERAAREARQEEVRRAHEEENRKRAEAELEKQRAAQRQAEQRAQREREVEQARLEQARVAKETEERAQREREKDQARRERERLEQEARDRQEAAAAAAADVERHRRAREEAQRQLENQERERREREEAVAREQARLAEDTRRQEESRRQRAAEEARRQEEIRVQREAEEQDRFRREQEAERYRRYESERKDVDQKHSGWGPVAAGAVAAATVGAVMAGREHEKSRGRKSRDASYYDNAHSDRPSRRSDADRDVPEPDDLKRRAQEQYGRGQGGVEVRNGYTAAEITPKNEHEGEPLMDDDIYDPDFFKRKRSSQEDPRHVDLARKAANKVVSDRRGPSPSSERDSYAEFFAPTDLLSQSAEGKTRSTSPHADNEIQVYHARDAAIQSHFHGANYGYGRSKDAPYGVPRLNVISPTPPPGSEKSSPESRKAKSPLSKSLHEDEIDEEETVKSTTSGKSERSRSISWGADKTHVYDVETPDSHYDRDSYITSPDIRAQEVSAGAAGVAGGATAGRTLHEIVVESPSGEEHKYSEDEWAQQEKQFGQRKSKKGKDGDVEDIVEEVTPDREPHHGFNFYRQPFADSVSDMGTGIFNLDSPGTEGAPPVRGFVEGETEESTPVEEKTPHVPGGFDDDMGDIYRPRREKVDPVSAEVNDEQATTAGASREPEPAWEPPLSKKDKKKREKAAKRSSIAEVDPATPTTESAPASTSLAETTEEPVENFAPLSKKDKKKAKKQGLADLASSMMSEPPQEREPVVDAAPSVAESEPPLSKKEQKKRDKEAKKQGMGFADVTDTILATGGIAAAAAALESTEESGSGSGAGKKKKKGKKAKLGEATYDDPRDMKPASEAATGSSMPGGWDDEPVSQPKAADTEATSAFTDPWQTDMNEGSAPPAAPEPPSAQDADPWADFTSSKKSKKKNKRNSAAFNVPDVSSPLRSEVPMEDYMGEVKRQDDQAQDGEAQLNGHQKDRDIPAVATTTEQASREREPSDERGLLDDSDGHKDKDSSRRTSPDDIRSAVSAPAAESESRGKSRRDDSRRSNDDYEEPSYAYETRSVAASEPADLYESSKKSKRRSRHADDDDNVSVISTRSRRDREKEESPSAKKEKKGGLFGLFSRKSVDDARSSKDSRSDGAPLSRESTRESRGDDEDDESRRRRKKKHRSSEYGDDDDDTRSVKSESRRHRSRSELGDDDADDSRSKSGSRHRHRHSEADIEDDGRERRRRSTRDEDYDHASPARSEPGRSHRRHRDDEDSESRVRGAASESGRHHHRRRTDEDAYSSRDQSFLGMRVEDLPPLPVSRPASPDLAAVKQEQGEGSPADAESGSGLVRSDEDDIGSGFVTLNEDEIDPGLVRSDEDGSGPGLVRSDEEEIESVQPREGRSDEEEIESVQPREGSADEQGVVGPSRELPLETPPRLGSMHRPMSSTAVPLRFPFGSAPQTPASLKERAHSFSSPIAQSSPASPITPKTRQGRPHSNEIRPLYLVERTRKTPEVEEHLPSLPSSKPSSRASSVQESDDNYQSAVEELDVDSPSRHRSLTIDTTGANSYQREDYLDSQETTPKASQFQQILGEKLPKQAPQFYTWEDFARDEQMHDEEQNRNLVISDEEPVTATRESAEREVSSVNRSRSKSPYKDEHGNSYKSVAAAAMLGTAAVYGYHKLAERSPERSSEVATSEEKSFTTPEYAYPLPAPVEEATKLDEPVSRRESETPSMSQKSSSKKIKGKKGRKQSVQEDELEQSTTGPSENELAKDLNDSGNLNANLKDEAQPTASEPTTELHPVRSNEFVDAPPKDNAPDRLQHQEPSIEERGLLASAAAHSMPVLPSVENVSKDANVEQFVEAEKRPAVSSDEPEIRSIDTPQEQRPVPETVLDPQTVSQEDSSDFIAPKLTRKLSKKAKRKQKAAALFNEEPDDESQQLSVAPGADATIDDVGPVDTSPELAIEDKSLDASTATSEEPSQTVETPQLSFGMHDFGNVAHTTYSPWQEAQAQTFQDSMLQMPSTAADGHNASRGTAESSIGEGSASLPESDDPKADDQPVLSKKQSKRDKRKQKSSMWSEPEAELDTSRNQPVDSQDDKPREKSQDNDGFAPAAGVAAGLVAGGALAGVAESSKENSDFETPKSKKKAKRDKKKTLSWSEPAIEDEPVKSDSVPSEPASSDEPGQVPLQVEPKSEVSTELDTTPAEAQIENPVDDHSFGQVTEHGPVSSDHKSDLTADVSRETDRSSQPQADDQWFAPVSTKKGKKSKRKSVTWDLPETEPQVKVSTSSEEVATDDKVEKPLSFDVEGEQEPSSVANASSDSADAKETMALEHEDQSIVEEVKSIPAELSSSEPTGLDTATSESTSASEAAASSDQANIIESEQLNEPSADEDWFAPVVTKKGKKSKKKKPSASTDVEPSEEVQPVVDSTAAPDDKSTDATALPEVPVETPVESSTPTTEPSAIAQPDEAEDSFAPVSSKKSKKDKKRKGKAQLWEPEPGNDEKPLDEEASASRQLSVDDAAFADAIEHQVTEEQMRSDPSANVEAPTKAESSESTAPTAKLENEAETPAVLDEPDDFAPVSARKGKKGRKGKKQPQSFDFTEPEPENETEVVDSSTPVEPAADSFRAEPEIETKDIDASTADESADVSFVDAQETQEAHDGETSIGDVITPTTADLPASEGELPLDEADSQPKDLESQPAEESFTPVTSTKKSKKGKKKAKQSFDWTETDVGPDSVAPAESREEFPASSEVEPASSMPSADVVGSDEPMSQPVESEKAAEPELAAPSSKKKGKKGKGKQQSFDWSAVDAEAGDTALPEIRDELSTSGDAPASGEVLPAPASTVDDGKDTPVDLVEPDQAPSSEGTLPAVQDAGDSAEPEKPALSRKQSKKDKKRRQQQAFEFRSEEPASEAVESVPDAQIESRDDVAPVEVPLPEGDDDLLDEPSHDTLEEAAHSEDVTAGQLIDAPAGDESLVEPEQPSSELQTSMHERPGDEDAVTISEPIADNWDDVPSEEQQMPSDAQTLAENEAPSSSGKAEDDLWATPASKKKGKKGKKSRQSTQDSWQEPSAASEASAPAETIEESAQVLPAQLVEGTHDTTAEIDVGQARDIIMTGQASNVFAWAPSSRKKKKGKKGTASGSQTPLTSEELDRSSEVKAPEAETPRDETGQQLKDTEAETTQASSKPPADELAIAADTPLPEQIEPVTEHAESTQNVEQPAADDIWDFPTSSKKSKKKGKKGRSSVEVFTAPEVSERTEEPISADVEPRNVLDDATSVPLPSEDEPSVEVGPPSESAEKQQIDTDATTKPTEDNADDFWAAIPSKKKKGKKGKKSGSGLATPIEEPSVETPQATGTAQQDTVGEPRAEVAGAQELVSENTDQAELAQENLVEDRLPNGEHPDVVHSELPSAAEIPGHESIDTADEALAQPQAEDDSMTAKIDEAPNSEHNAEPSDPVENTSYTDIWADEDIVTEEDHDAVRDLMEGSTESAASGWSPSTSKKGKKGKKGKKCSVSKPATPLEPVVESSELSQPAKDDVAMPGEADAKQIEDDNIPDVSDLVDATSAKDIEQAQANDLYRTVEDTTVTTDVPEALPGLPAEDDPTAEPPTSNSTDPVAEVASEELQPESTPATGEPPAQEPDSFVIKSSKKSKKAKKNRQSLLDEPEPSTPLAQSDSAAEASSKPGNTDAVISTDSQEPTEAEASDVWAVPTKAKKGKKGKKSKQAFSWADEPAEETAQPSENIASENIASTEVVPEPSADTAATLDASAEAERLPTLPSSPKPEPFEDVTATEPLRLEQDQQHVNDPTLSTEATERAAASAETPLDQQSNEVSSDAMAVDIADRTEADVAPEQASSTSPEPESSAPIDDSSEAFVVKKGKKDKKKGKKSRSSTTDPWADAADDPTIIVQTSQTGAADGDDKATNEASAIASAALMTAGAAALETTKTEPVEDEWANLSTKKSKKSKKKSGKSGTSTHAVDEIVSTIDDQISEHATTQGNAGKSDVFANADADHVEAEAESSTRDDPVPHTSDAANLDQQLAEQAVSRAVETSSQDKPVSVDISSASMPKDEIKNDEAVDPELPQAIQDELLSGQQEPEDIDTGTESRDLTTAEAPSASPTHQPSSDIDFTATVAAGLADSGFNPDMVINDPVFQRRASPPGAVAEADPDEVFSTTTTKRKKGKKSKKSLDTADVPAEEPAIPAESAALDSSAADDFNDTISQSLQGTGFDPALLAKALESSDNVPSTENDAEPEEFYFTTTKRNKGKKGKKSQTFADIESDKPTAINTDQDSGSRDHNVATDDNVKELHSIGVEEQPEQFLLENDTLQQATSDVQKHRSGKIPDTEADAKNTMPADPSVDILTVGHDEMDMDEMDRQYKAYKKNKRKQKKLKAIGKAAEQSDNPESAMEDTERSTAVSESEALSRNTTHSDALSRQRTLEEAPGARKDLGETDDTPGRAAARGIVSSVFPGLERVKRRTPPPQSTDHKPRGKSPAGVVHTSEVSQFLPTEVPRSPSPRQSAKGASTTNDHSSTGLIAVGVAAGLGAAALGHHQAFSQEPSWSFAGLRDDNAGHSRSVDDNKDHQIIRDSGYQESKQSSRPASHEVSSREVPEILHTSSSRDSLRQRRSLEPLQIGTPDQPFELENPKRRKNEDRGRALETHSRTPSAETPLKPTSKDRASYLFQSPPDILAGVIDGAAQALDPHTPSKEPDNLHHAPAPSTPKASQHQTNDNGVYDRSMTSPLSAATSPNPPLHAIPEEHHAVKRRKADSDVGGPEQIKALQRAETPQRIRARQHTLSPSDRPHISIPTHSASRSVSNPLSTDELINRLSWPSVDEHNDTVDIDRHLGHRHSKPLLPDPRSPSVLSNRSNASGAHFRSPQELRSYSRSSNRSSTPSLRRTSLSGDLRAAASRRGDAGSAVGVAASPITIPFEPPPTPPLNDDEVIHGSASRAVDMNDDVFSGFGDAQRSQVSPTRPPSVRKRQSMHISELESRIDQLAAENRSLQEARHYAEQTNEVARDVNGQTLQEALAARDLELREKDAEIHQIKAMLQPLQEEVARLLEINGGLTEANRNLVDDTNGRYATLQSEHAEAHQKWQSASRDLETMRGEHGRITSGMKDIVEAEIATALADKNAEILRLREQLDIAAEQIRALQVQIQSSKHSDFLVQRDEDYFDGSCQKLCQHVQQWVLRFSKISDNRVCRLSTDLKDDKLEARLDNAILDGSDVDKLLVDRVRRRDVFMSVVMTMVWEYIFTRYLFGMDREQRQKLKALEKLLAEVGPPRAVAHWRATTLTLLSKRPSFDTQCALDTEAVAHEIFGLLCSLLPPPPNAEQQLLASLQKVIGIAVNLSIEMRTQRAEYIMLPPLQPEYDTNGDLVRKVHFNASLMNERSGFFSSNEELAAEQAVVKIVLFPLVVKKGDDVGEGEEEIVVCPAQVLVQNDGGRGKKVVRVMSGAMEIDDPIRSRQSRHSLMSEAPGSVGF